MAQDFLSHKGDNRMALHHHHLTLVLVSYGWNSPKLREGLMRDEKKPGSLLIYTDVF